jgi:hypothetical protein
LPDWLGVSGPGRGCKAGGMADRAFDPAQLNADASINRVEIAALPGVPSDVAGRLAGDICSRDALADLVRHREHLPVPEPHRLADQLASLVESSDRRARTAARGVLEEFGRRLGGLIATLAHPTTPARQGTSPLRRACLEHWLSIRAVDLTGGLVAVPVADPVIGQAREVAARSCPGLRVEAGPWAQLAPMVGAARMADRREGRVLIVDCGHSALKPGIAEQRDGRLVALRILPAAPAPDHGDPGQVARGVAGVLAKAAAAASARGPLSMQVMVSVASYLRDGYPVDDTRSAYGQLGTFTDELRAAVEAVLQHPVDIRYLHDGTAAAAAVTSSIQPAAVITVGSWLGVGFVPPQQELLVLDDGIEITALDPG